MSTDDGKPRIVDRRSTSSGPNIVSDLGSLLLTGHKYKTVLADPPWRYANTASRGAAQNHYPTMTVDEICREPIPLLVEDRAHLHLWTTNAFLEAAFTVMRVWGFEYKSCLVWVKPSIGLGNYYRVSHEFLMFGIRGRLRFGRNDIPSWVHSPRTAHSRKPFRFRELIEQVSPDPLLGALWTSRGTRHRLVRLGQSSRAAAILRF